jgi:phosphoserine phosphatase RsbU/P
MTAAASSSSLLADYLGLFAQTEIFIFVFMEIVTKTEVIKRTIFKKPSRKDTAVFVVVFGLFSIFGTYIGNMQDLGVITNIRDLAPIVAGLVAGPFVGLAVGLIGGVHRLFLGGVTCIPCSLATVLAGLVAGLIYHLYKGKLLGVIPAMFVGVGVELIHGALALVLVSPFQEALAIVVSNIPPMAIAVSLGVGISMIIVNSTKESASMQKERTEAAADSSLKTDANEVSRLWRFKQFLLLHRACDDVVAKRCNVAVNS